MTGGRNESRSGRGSDEKESVSRRGTRRRQLLTEIGLIHLRTSVDEVALGENLEESGFEDPFRSELGLSDSDEQRRLRLEHVEGVEVV